MKITKTRVLGGISTNRSNSSMSVSAILTVEKSIAAGAAASLTSGGGTSSGVFHFDAGTNVLNLDLESVISIYWDGGARHGVTIDNGDGSGNITFSGGSGSTLPANATVLIVGKMEIIPATVSFTAMGGSTILCMFDVNEPSGIGPLAIQFRTSDGVVYTAWRTLDANKMFDFYNDQAIEDFETEFAAFFGGPGYNIEEICVTNGHLTAGTVQLAIA